MGTGAGAVGISFLLKKVKEVEKMGIKNLTEAEEKEFYRLVGKMNGKEPDKKQDVKVKKPIYGQEYFFPIVMDGLNVIRGEIEL